MVVAHNEKTLYEAHIFDAIMSSLYMYDRKNDLVRAFYEVWPFNQYFAYFCEELSISL